MLFFLNGLIMHRGLDYVTVERRRLAVGIHSSKRERLEIIREERLAIRWHMGTRRDASEARFI